MVNTRRTRRDITPPSQVIYKEHSTKKRIRFYDALDSRKPKELVPSFATRFGIARSTGHHCDTPPRPINSWLILLRTRYAIKYIRFNFSITIFVLNRAN
ncbi:hypothetical protein ACMFMF_007500 [Clarireedia jacksonii]